MKKTLILIVVLLFGILHSCGDKMSRTVDTMEMEAEKQARQVILTTGQIELIPDSLRSPEQKAQLRKFESLVYEHCAIKNKRWEVTISKKEFKQTIGLPEIYYDILKKDIADMNRYLDTFTVVPIEDVIDSFKKSQDEYFVRKNKMD
jgi:hypothetical protein